MKTQYFARASIKRDSFVDEELGVCHGYAVQNYVKIDKPLDLLRLVKHTAFINTTGDANIQLIPVTKDVYIANRSFLKFKTLDTV